MSSTHLVDEQLRETLNFFDALGLNDVPITAENLSEYRNKFDALADNAEEADEFKVTQSEMRFTPDEDGPEQRVLVFKPAQTQELLPALLYIHGGGFIFGSPEGSALLCRQIAHELNIVVVAPAYRLAPEHPFPAGHNDCYAALRWLRKNAGSLGVDSARIGISGDSAGGGMAASLAQRSIAESGPNIKFQALIYPMLDNETGTLSSGEDSPVGEFVWTRESNQYAWSAYLKGGAHQEKPFAVPASAKTLQDQPPCWIGTGSLDLFVNENLRYASRLIESGVPTELYVCPGAFHAFIVDQGASVTNRFLSNYFDALRRGLSIETPMSGGMR